MIQICPMSAVRQFCSPFAARAPLQSHACDQQVPLCLQHTLASWPGQSNQKSPENKGKCSMKSSRELITCESTKYNGNRGYSTVMEIMDFDASICASSRTSATKCNTVASQKTFSALLTFLAKTRENKFKPRAKSSVGGKGHRAAVRLMRCCVQEPSLTRNCVPCFVCCWRLHEFARKSAGA